MHDETELIGWAENSHDQFRRRERAMLWFRRMHKLQKFASAHASVHNHFPTEHHLQNRYHYKQTRAAAFTELRRFLRGAGGSVTATVETRSH